jgi:hypothetical protein
LYIIFGEAFTKNSISYFSFSIEFAFLAGAQNT